MTRPLLIASALYMAAVGLALTAFPLQFGRGAVPPDAGPALVALLRLLGGPFLGVAALNWLFRRAEPGPALTRVLIANLIGFAAVALNDVWGVASGEARDLARLFVVIHTLFALAFALALRRGGR